MPGHVAVGWGVSVRNGRLWHATCTCLCVSRDNTPDPCQSQEFTMTASTCRHADRPLAFTVAIGGTPHHLRAHRIHPVGQVLDGSRDGLDATAASAGDLDDFSWGLDVGDAPEGLMMEPQGVSRRQRLRPSRAACFQAAGRE